MSSDHFRKNFKRVTGTSPVKYINNLRVRHAMDLLKNPSMRISSIAAQTGFGDINNFHPLLHSHQPHIAFGLSQAGAQPKL